VFGEADGFCHAICSVLSSATVEPAPPGDRRRPLQGEDGLHAVSPGRGVLI